MTSLACTDLLCDILIPFNTLRVCRSAFKGSRMNFQTEFLACTLLISIVLTFDNSRWQLGRYACQVVTSAVVVLMSTSIYNFICANLDRCHNNTYIMIILMLVS